MLMASKYPEIVVATNDGLIRNCAYECGTAMRIEDLVSQLIKRSNRAQTGLETSSEQKATTFL